MNTEIKSVWDFVAEYYPNYSSCNEIMRNDDLCKIVNNELNGDAVKLFEQQFNNNYDEAVESFNQSTKYIYEKAIQGYLNQTSLVTGKIEKRIVELEEENRELTSGNLILINKTVISELKKLLR